MPSHKRLLILDTSAILTGIQSSLPNTDAYTTQLVISEAKRKLKEENKTDTLDIRSLIIMEPSLEAVNSVITHSLKLGEKSNLSPVDISVLALGKQLLDDSTGEIEILTDDYSIQNVANAFGLKFHSIATQRIKKQIRWIYYCKGCRTKYEIPPKNMRCTICGSEISRKPFKIQNIK